MNKKLQCKECGKAVYGEDLYNYDGKILCRYCIVSRVYEGLIPCEYVGTCNDKTYPNKNQQLDQLKQQLAEKDKEIEEILSSKKHFKTCAENMSDVLKTINSVLPKLQENGLNYKKVADDVIALIKEKDKEIEKLKQQYTILENENSKLTTELIMNKYKKAQKEVSFGKQLAIAELEKVLTSVDVPNLSGNSQKSISLSRLRKVIQQQIKELKEKE